MFCPKCGEKIEKDSKFCKKCGTQVLKEKDIKEKTKVNNEEKDKKINVNNNLMHIVIIITLVLAFFSLTIFLIINQTKDVNTTTNVVETENKTLSTPKNNTNNTENKTTEKSFFGMKYQDKLTEKQQIILDYFDNDYFHLSSTDYDSLQRNTKIYKNAKIHSGLEIIKVIKSTDTECEIIGRMFDCDTDEDGYFGPNPLDMEYKDKVLIKMSQLDERLIEKDSISFYGIYEGTTNITVDGKDYIVPVINASRVIKLNYHEDSGHRFRLADIEKVATAVFDENVKIKKPVYTEDNFDAQTYCYKIVFDNQSNENFKEFLIAQDYGYIWYNTKSSEINNNTKEFNISADFENYIILSYDSELGKIYIEYYNKKYEKLWQRKLDLKSNYSGYDQIVLAYDYTKDRLAFNLENDLYLINLDNGQDLIQPTLVGEKIRVIMQDNGMILIGNDNKDGVMYVDYNGNIIQRNNIDTNMKMYNTQTQYVDGNLVAKLYGQNKENKKYGDKFVIINNDGTINSTTEDNYYQYY